MREMPISIKQALNAMHILKTDLIPEKDNGKAKSRG
jgi:hypothetical protein